MKQLKTGALTKQPGTTGPTTFARRGSLHSLRAREGWWAFLDTYRTLCLALPPEFRRIC